MQSNSREPGAPAAAGTIPLCVPHLAGNEWQYVKECLDTNFVSSVGPFVDRFEQMVADYVGTEYAIATVNGTAALHVALLVAGVEPDDEVLVSTLSFIAPANAIRYIGAWPVFIDAEPRFWQMDPARVIDFLERGCDWVGGELRNRSTGRRVRAILPVHILGHPVDIDPMLEAARKFGLPVVEDATESLGALYKARKVGNLGDIACFSFNGNKLITTGGGGMIVTDNPQWAERAKYLTTQAKDDALEYIHGAVGFNYRLTNIQAAVGCAQMEALPGHIQRKRQIAREYGQVVTQLAGVVPMEEASWAHSVFWMYTIRVLETEAGLDSRALMSVLDTKGIQSRPLWQPLHLSPAHRSASTSKHPVAERLAREALSLPCSVGMTDQEQQKVLHSLGGNSDAG